MSGKSSKKRRDEFRALLRNGVSSPQAPGIEVAEKALRQSSERTSSGVALNESSEATVSARTENSLRSEGETRPTKNSRPEPKPGPPAIKISVSLYPVHLEQLEAIKERLRKLGQRSATDSLAVKIAISGFDFKSAQLRQLLKDARMQDGRVNSRS